MREVFPFEYGWTPAEAEYWYVRKIRQVAHLARGGDFAPFRVFGETQEDVDWSEQYVIPALQRILTYVPAPLSEQIDIMVTGYSLVSPGIATTFNAPTEWQHWQGVNIDRSSFANNDRLVPLSADEEKDQFRFMPVFESGWLPQLEYIILHEYGHVMAQPLLEGDRRWPTLKDTLKDRMASLLGYPVLEPGLPLDVAATLSSYGQVARGEGWAEAFAEWYGTRGETDNAAARWYASTFNWDS